MKIRLVHKFFATFLLTFFIIVGLMVGIIQVVAYRNFADYVGRMELEQLDGLVNQLRNEYVVHGGWDRLKKNNRLWHEYLQIVLSQQDRKSSGDGKTPNFPPPLRPPIGPSPGADFSYKRRQPWDGTFDPELYNEGEDPNAFSFSGNPMDIRPRVALFDENRNPIQGPALKKESVLFKAIKLDKKTIGLLALKKNEYLSHPLDVDYMRQQINILYYIGAGAILLTVIVSLFLSRHLLQPIRQLADGTKNLAARNFKTVISVSSNDELGQLAADFNKLAKTLDQYEQMRRQWISDISHELRTPLAVLRGEIEALIDGVRRINNRTLASLHAEIIHIIKIVNDLHNLSVAESGTLQFKSESVDPLNILKGTLHLFENRFNQKRIECIDNLNARQPVVINGDRDRLIQLFTNLLENCLRYTASPGKISVTHSVSREYLYLNIEDTAPGVPQDDLERIFDRLYRIDSARSRDHGGSGLGLSICKHIVENHGGRIFAEQSDMGGLKISIRFGIEKKS